MLKKANRIRKDKEFDRIFKAGQSFYGNNFGLRVAKNGLDKDRFSIMISTKVSKKAVIRNHIRRQIREIIRQEMSRMNVGYDIVFIVFNQILDKNFQEVKEAIVKSFMKLGLYK